MNNPETYPNSSNLKMSDVNRSEMLMNNPETYPNSSNLKMSEFVAFL
jgi:hypothetical protein